MEEVRPLKLHLTPRALRHLVEIETFIARERPIAAKQVGARLRESIDLLCEFPGFGRPGPRKNTREWPVPDLPYIVIFRVQRNTLEVVGIYHGARKYRT
jgi:toxin ParE1/3/4